METKICAIVGIMLLGSCLSASLEERGTADNCQEIEGDNDYTQSSSIELTGLAVGDLFSYDFVTYGEDGEEYYQNIGISMCFVDLSYFSCAGSDDRYLYTRGSASGEECSEGDAVYAWVYPYGSSTSTGSAYTGTWKLTVCAVA
jgi:hypothetical protein